MILRSIRLEDFGLFAGVTELDLIPRVRKGVSAPVVLIGGKNGAGKTTLLEAVRLALYGRRALGPRVALSEYEAYLRDRINRNALKLEAAVALEFDYAEAGAVHRYRVRREWSIRGKSIVEDLLLDKDGEAISSVPREEWHQFLQELIPPGVSQLFFFDGEKIQQIAGDEDNEQLAEAVRSLLGIELVGRLRTDLGLFLARHQRREAGDVASRLESIIRELANSSNAIQKLSDDVAELISTRDLQARAAEQIRRRFVSEGGDAALNRNRIESEREEVRRAANRGEHELRELANQLLPFAMAPKLIGVSATLCSPRALAAVKKPPLQHCALPSMFGRTRVSRSGRRAGARSIGLISAAFCWPRRRRLRERPRCRPLPRSATERRRWRGSQKWTLRSDPGRSPSSRTSSGCPNEVGNWTRGSKEPTAPHPG